MAHTQRNKLISIQICESVLALWTQVECFKSFDSKLGISNRAASNIVTNVAERGHLLALKPGGKERQIVNLSVVEHIEYQKICKPSTSTVELRAALVRDGVRTAENLLPSIYARTYSILTKNCM